jgi:predicted ATPase
MITRLFLANIRMFEGSGWDVRLTPLSVICGTNSAGKSTLLKCLLLLKQTQLFADTGASAPGRLRLAGADVDLGTFSSFVSHNDTSRQISIGLSFTDIVHRQVLDPLLSSVWKSHQDLVSSASDESGDWINYELHSIFTFGCQTDDQSSAPRREGKQHPASAGEGRSAFVDQAFLTSSSHQLEIGSRGVLSWNIDRKSALTQANYQYALSLPRDFLEQVAETRMMRIPGRRTRAELESSMRGLLAEQVFAPFSQRLSARNQLRNVPIPWPIPALIRYVQEDLEYHLANLHYLGPLRSPAKRYYMVYLDESPSLDQAGEFLPYILRHSEDTSVDYAAPDGSIRQESLRQALDNWLQYFRTGLMQDGGGGAELELLTTGEVLAQFQLRSTGGAEKHSLMDSGFGYSQLLPILVRGLLLQWRGTLVVEQPELHLNPALQVRLAEFLAAVTKTGRQVLVETHSEHLVNAIRVLAAEDETGAIADKSSILFVDSEGPRPVLRRLEVQPDGTVPDWPSHFFGEALSLSGRLLRAQRRFR